MFRQLSIQLFVIIACIYTVSGQPYNYNPGNFYFQIDRTARAFSTDSITNFVRSTKTDLSNNFIVKGARHHELIAKLHKFNEVLIFDELGKKFRLHDDRKCVNNQLMLKNLQLGLVDTLQYLDSFTAFLQPISESNIASGKITAIVFWNFSTGVQLDDVPFEWERLLKAKFGKNINVLKVNTDVSESWLEDYKRSELAFLQNVLDKLNSSFR